MGRRRMDDKPMTAKLCNEPSDCPEYVRCDANICPLDVDWRKRIYHTGESVCLFLRETVKQTADEQLSINATFEHLRSIAIVWIAEEKQEVERRSYEAMPRGRGDHFKAILAASKSGSMLAKRAAFGQRVRDGARETLTG